MKFLKYFSLIILAVFLTTACSEETFEEINVDPTQLSEVDMQLMLPEIQSQFSFNKGATPGRMAGIIMQQYEGFDAQQVQYTTYIIGQDAFNNYWRFAMYTGVLRSCKVLMDKAAEEGATFYSGVAKVIMASEYGLLTSFFGDIPYSQALLGTENLKPAYDKQEDVYKGVQAMLDDAISDLGSGTGYAGGDLIFDGDADAWTKTAYALKARYQMHLQKREGNAASTVLTLLGSAFTSLDEQPNFTFGTGIGIDNWSLDQFGVERPQTLIMGQYFVDLMMDDPRRDLFMYTDGTTWFYHEVGNSGLVYAQSAATIPMISYVEVNFLE
ncbi:MAG: SusD/RagB family nutrient-binding outer membrane lipoprotein, partial [Bacteroidetes bacterium]